MGLSVAELLVPNVAAYWVLLTAGKSRFIGIRRLRITAEDAPGGAKVHVEAWLESYDDMNADPNAVLGALPRRQVWEAAAVFVARLGVSPLAVFRHVP